MKNTLRTWRRKLQVSQVTLAGAARCSPVTISDVERLGHFPRPETRARIAKALGVDVGLLWPGEASNG